MNTKSKKTKVKVNEITEEEGYKCNCCGSPYDDAEVATDCCEPEPCAIFRCPTCSQVYEYKNQAENCCL